jgi:Skp family chaperone for outer membrane proteins
MMKRVKFAQTILAILVIGVSAFAQQGAAPVGKGKIAVINTAVFQEQIGEFKTKLEALNKQFEPRIRDLDQLATQIKTREDTLKTQGQALTPAKVAELTEQVEAMKREYQRKGEDLQADGGKARDLALQPVSEKLERFARDYTAKKGITVLVDLANALNSGMIVWYDPRTDVTADFVKEYNKAHTAPATGTTPKP